MPQSRAQGKGVITFGLALVGARAGFTPDVVLSEGETRIVALAAFLADTTGSNQLAPFIFDDPISSLDQDFEERVVTRLVELAKTRQVIIFTHRLSLIALVEAVIKNTVRIRLTRKLPTPCSRFDGWIRFREFWRNTVCGTPSPTRHLMRLEITSSRGSKASGRCRRRRL